MAILRLVVFGLVCLVALVEASFAEFWYVDITGGGDFTTIQEAVDAASDGDVIFVREGVYYENIVIAGKWLEIRGESPSLTHIVGGALMSVVLIEDNADVWLSDFTLSKGMGTLSGTSPGALEWWYGGGVLVLNAEAKIFHCTITDCSAFFGGGIAVIQQEPPGPLVILENNTITDNRSGVEGGGIFMANALCDIHTTKVMGNISRYGAGIAARYSTVNIQNGLICHNRGVYTCGLDCTLHAAGCGIFSRESSFTIMSSTIAHNTKTAECVYTDGGAILASGSSLMIINSILYHNSYPEITLREGESQSCHIGFHYSNLQGGPDDIAITEPGVVVDWDGNGNISVPPLFWGPYNYNYRLAMCSPCLGAGMSGLAFTLIIDEIPYVWHPFDIEYNDRPTPAATSQDMGAYEHGRGQPVDPTIVPVDYGEIAIALEYAMPGDVVIIESGVYDENIDYGGKDVIVASRYWLTGDVSYIDQTIIDGGDDDSVVKFTNGESRSAVLCGVTIRNGLAQSNGGGVLCEYSSPTLSNLVIADNVSLLDAGGIICRGCDPIIVDTVISGNTSGRHGGGISCTLNSSPILRNVMVSNNVAVNGGGIWCYSNSNPLLEDVSLYDNIANKGGGLYCYDNCSPTLNYVTVFNDSASVHGGGILAESFSNLDMMHCTISHNASPVGGGIALLATSTAIIDTSIVSFSRNGQAVYCGSGSSAQLYYSDIYGNSGGDWTGSIAPQSGVNGNHSVDPLYVDGPHGDLNLAETSPCLPENNPAFAVVGANGPTSDNNSSLDDQRQDSRDYIVIRSHPNPFNPQAEIYFSMTRDDRVKIEIYDVRGRRVRTVIDEMRKRGAYSVTWNSLDDNGQAVASGTYLACIQTTNHTGHVKMALIK